MIVTDCQPCAEAKVKFWVFRLGYACSRCQSPVYAAPFTGAYYHSCECNPRARTILTAVRRGDHLGVIDYREAR